MPRVRPLLGTALVALLCSLPASALNKQGMSTPTVEGSVEIPAVNLSGYVFTGVLAYNPSYAARPDNSGRALMRYGAHLDLDLYRKHLTLTYDANVFSDNQADTAAGRLRPSEHDHIVGLIGRIGDFEIGAHYEADLPADRPGSAQSYVDAHGRYYWDLGRAWPAFAQRLPRQGVWGFFTVAGFLFNRTYAARPDLSGLAMLRLVGHLEIDLYRPWVSLSIDLNFFTDRQTSYGLVPSELDTTIGIVVHLGDFDVSIMAENDRPLDRPGLEQSYVMTMLSYRFDVHRMVAARRAIRR